MISIECCDRNERTANPQNTNFIIEMVESSDDKSGREEEEEEEEKEGRIESFLDSSKPHKVQFVQTLLESSNDNSNNNNVNRNRNLSESSSVHSLTSVSSTVNYSYNAPDGGWGWVVVLASFMVNLIADGVTFSFGILFIEFQKEFGESKAVTAGVVSMFHAVPLLSGPIASALTDRYGCRKVTVMGSILAALGFFVSSFANSIGILYITFGVISGFGLSLCYVAAIVIVAFYFDEKRSFATGISVSGSGVGTFVFASLTQTLIHEYEWRGTCIILAGCFLQILICGLLFRDLEWSHNKNSNTNQNGNSLVQNNEEYHSKENFVRASSSLIDLPTFLSNHDFLSKDAAEALRRKDYSMAFRLIRDGGQMTDQICPSPTIDKRKILLKRKMSSFFRKNSTVTGITPPPPLQKRKLGFDVATIDILPGYKKHSYKMKMMRRSSIGNQHRGLRFRLRASSCPNIQHVSTIANENNRRSIDKGTEDENKEIYLTQDRGISSYFKGSHFSDPRFIVFCISNLILYSWYDVMYVYLVDYAEKDLKFGAEDSTWFISIIGIFNTLGELGVGWIGDQTWFNLNSLYAICMFFCGATTAAVPLLHDYTALGFMAGIYGFAISANYSLTSPILVDLVSLQQFSNAYGFLLLTQGIANLIGPPFAGFLYDITSKWIFTFGFAGFFIFFSGFLLFIIPLTSIVKKWLKGTVKTTRSDKDEEDGVTETIVMLNDEDTEGNIINV